MQKQRTEPGIIRVICAKLLAWQSGSTEEIQVGTFTLFRRWFRNRMRSDGNPFWKAGPLEAGVKFNIGTMNFSTVAEQGFAG
jgi:hypothetical protein